MKNHEPTIIDNWNTEEDYHSSLRYYKVPLIKRIKITLIKIKKWVTRNH